MVLNFCQNNHTTSLVYFSGSSDSSVRIFDRRMLGSNPGRCKAGLVSKFLLPEMEGKKRRITAIEYRPGLFT